MTATTYSGERTSKNYAFVDPVARKNVDLTITNIRKDSPVLARMESSGAIKITGAMYNLATQVVEFFSDGGRLGDGLMSVPGPSLPNAMSTVTSAFPDSGHSPALSGKAQRAELRH